MARFATTTTLWVKRTHMRFRRLLLVLRACASEIARRRRMRHSKGGAAFATSFPCNADEISGASILHKDINICSEWCRYTVWWQTPRHRTSFLTIRFAVEKKQLTRFLFFIEQVRGGTINEDVLLVGAGSWNQTRTELAESRVIAVATLYYYEGSIQFDTRTESNVPYDPNNVKEVTSSASGTRILHNQSRNLIWTTWKPIEDLGKRETSRVFGYCDWQQWVLRAAFFLRETQAFKKLGQFQGICNDWWKSPSATQKQKKSELAQRKKRIFWQVLSKNENTLVELRLRGAQLRWVVNQKHCRSHYLRAVAH